MVIKVTSNEKTGKAVLSEKTLKEPFSPVRMLWKAVSTLVESRADVSMKLRLFFSAKAFASSVGTVVDKQSSDSTPVVRRSNGSVALLSSRVPDLGLNGLPIHLDGSSGELDPDGGLRLQVELIPCEPGEQVRLADSGVTNQNNFEKVIVLVIPGPHLGSFSPRSLVEVNQAIK